MKKCLLFAAFIALLATGCSNQANNSMAAPSVHQAAPEVDTSTPDRALKSMWAISDWRDSFLLGEAQKIEQSDEAKSWRQLSAKVNTKSVADGLSRPEILDKYSRDILQATVETESRAVIVAHIKNATPLPADAQLSKSQQSTREKGERVKYVLEKEKDSWKISEVWVWNEYSNSFIKRRPDNTPNYPVYVFRGW